MKELLAQYASYNLWAHQKIIDVATQLKEEQIRKEIESSFSSIFKTFLHTWDAESIWWQRLKLAEHVEIPSENFTSDFDEMQNKLLSQSKLWEEWVANANEHHLLHIFAYQNSKREQFKQPTFQMLQHLFNHSTYHRGQLVTMIRQLGVVKIPPTDFIVFSRSKKK